MTAGPEGFNHRQRGQERFTAVTRKDGLPSDVVAFIVEDSRGTLWVGTKNGVCTVVNGSITIQHLGTEGKTPQFFCAYEDKHGVLWFGGDRGLVRRRENKTGPLLFTYNMQSGLMENMVYSIHEDDRGYLWTSGPNGISRLEIRQLEQFARGSVSRLTPDRYHD